MTKKQALDVLLPDELLVRVSTESAEAADAVFRAQKSVDASRTLVRQAVRRLVLRQHRNHLAWLRLLTLPIIIRDLVHHPDYGLDTNEFALLLYKVFQVSPPMALHLLNLIGLAGPGWVMGVIADNRSADCYAREIYAAMMNFGTLDDSRLEMCVFTRLAYNARALDHYAPDMVGAVVALCQISERAPGENSKM
ncbi:hypothetical protein BC828DRAFT_418240 [Blastocladiella britannica]|nr:hypothetical protein BC828DRAFT_418240 [Blastocladiella britannica]